MKTYHYEMVVIDGNGQLWNTRGDVSCALFPDAQNLAMKDAFVKLTNGNTVYGSPGAGGCRGPYDIRSLLIEQRGNKQ